MKRQSASLVDTEFDLLVCGGGVYGAWTAYDAALRGLKVALIEQGDWASATSSASTKLIHGGLRYLETLDFKLVKKALTERDMLLAAGHHRVWPLRFGVPIYRGGRLSRWQLKAGLTLYDFFAKRRQASLRHQYLRRDEFAAKFPYLLTDQLIAGFIYADAQTDDARLVLELIEGAISAGAVCVNYAKLTEFVDDRGEAVGAVVEDLASGGVLSVRARSMVMAVGPWLSTADESRDWCRLSKGVHLILPALDREGEALLLTAQSDGRVFFIIPWYGRTLLGTTDDDYRGNLDQIAVEKSEVEYLLREANHYLKKHWQVEDVIASYAGVRVMRRSEAQSPSGVSRDWELKVGKNGVLYSVGGKLTSAREDAALMVDAVCLRLGVELPCQTEGRALPWMPENFVLWSAEIVDQARKLGIDSESIRWLLRRHGSRTSEILKEVECYPELAQRVVPELPLIDADLLYCAREEMVLNLDDLLRRRMPLLILARLTNHELDRVARLSSLCA